MINTSIRFYLQDGVLKPAVVILPVRKEGLYIKNQYDYKGANELSSYEEQVRQALANPIFFKEKDDEDKIKVDIFNFSVENEEAGTFLSWQPSTDKSYEVPSGVEVEIRVESDRVYGNEETFSTKPFAFLKKPKEKEITQEQKIEGARGAFYEHEQSQSRESLLKEELQIRTNQNAELAEQLELALHGGEKFKEEVEKLQEDREERIAKEMNLDDEVERLKKENEDLGREEGQWVELLQKNELRKEKIQELEQKNKEMREALRIMYAIANHLRDSIEIMGEIKANVPLHIEAKIKVAGEKSERLAKEAAMFDFEKLLKQ